MKMEWIPTSEHLPEDKEEILFVFWCEYEPNPAFKVSLGCYHESMKAISNYRDGWTLDWSELAYWMPLPPLPEEMDE